MNLINLRHVLVLAIFLVKLGYCKEIILTEDRPYDVINIEVPENVMKLALNPTPMLKSRATITIPVQVNDDYLDDEDEDVDEDNEVIEPVVQNEEDIANTPVLEDPVVPETQVSNPALNPVANVPQVPALDSPQAGSDSSPTGPATGQVTRFPCTCTDGICGCCTRMILQRFGMNACGNITFVPEDFVFDVKLLVNNNTVIHRRVSASDPPPICFNPRRAPFIQVCAEISNIRIRNRNAFACLDIIAEIAGFPVYSASFRCFGLGSKGVQTGLKPKPLSAGPTPVNLFGGGQVDTDNDGGLISNAADLILGGDTGGGLIEGVSEGIFGGSDDDGGPLGAIGDAVGGLFES